MSPKGSSKLEKPVLIARSLLARAIIISGSFLWLSKLGFNGFDTCKLGLGIDPPTSDTGQASRNQLPTYYQRTRPLFFTVFYLRHYFEDMHRIRRRATAAANSDSGTIPWYRLRPANPPRSNTLEREAGGSLPESTKSHLTVIGQLRSVLLKWLNLLLVFVPVGIAAHYAGIDPTIVFAMNFVAIIPLAALLSTGTEEIALYCGEVVGGLLNASFGNAVELIVAVLALIKHEVVIVQTSLIGSILSNLLLVLGMAFVAGGVNRSEQKFNTTVAQTAASLLTVSCASLIVPTAFHLASDAGDAGITELSRGTAVVLLGVYASYLFFQLKTHEHMYSARSEKTPKESLFKRRPKEVLLTAPEEFPVSETATMREVEEGEEEEEEEEEKEQPVLTLWFALLVLVFSTVFVALCAESLVSSIDHLVSSVGISRVFVGLILLPIVGNAAEHATAVTVAIKDKMDLSIGVAVGSSMQIALLVIPLIVILGWCMGIDEMNLYFDGFQVMILFVSVLLVNYLIQDGRSNYLEGILLLALYVIVAVASWFYPSDGSLARAVGK